MRSTGYPPHAACVLGIMAGPVSYDREYNERLGYGTDQGRWLESTVKDVSSSTNPFRAFSSQKKGTPQPQQGQLHLAAQQPGLNRAALHSTQTAPLNSTHAATLHAGQPDQKLGVLATPQVMSTMPLTSRAHPSMAPAIDPSDAQHHDPRKNRLAKLGSGSPPMKILSHAEFNPGNARPLKNPSKPTALHTTTVQSAPQLSHPPCAYSQIASPQEQALPGSKASYAPHLQRFGQPTAENPLPTPSTTPHQKAAYPQPRLQHNLIPQPVLKSGHVTSSEIQPTQRSQPNHSHTLLEPGDPRTLGYGTDQGRWLEQSIKNVPTPNNPFRRNF